MIEEERVSSEEYVDFLKRTDLGSQYPKERFRERIERLVNTVTLSLTARNEEGLLVGALFGLTDHCCWLCVTDLGLDRDVSLFLRATAEAPAGSPRPRPA